MLVKCNKSSNFSDKSILDFGFGDGTLMRGLNELTTFKNRVGTEINKFSIQHLESNHELNPFDKIFHSNDLNNEYSEKFDFCICTEVLEHLYVEDIVPFLNNIKKISNFVIFTTPAPQSVFPLGFNLGEIKNTINNTEKFDSNSFQALEGAIHKSTVFPISMRFAGFKIKKINYPNNNINLISRTMIYYGDTKKINIERINYSGLSKSSFKTTKSSDYLNVYLNILIESSLQFPKHNKKFKFHKFLVHNLQKIILKFKKNSLS